MTVRIKNRIALITGAASGIGKATADLFEAEGAVVLRTDIADGNHHKLDVSKASDWRGFVDSIEHEHIDIVVNNAGISPHDNIENLDMATWDTIRGVVLDGVMLGCKHTLPLLKKSAYGAIVNVSSVAGIVGASEYTSYGAAKAGVRNVTKSVALHCARMRYNVRCNSVHPGSIDTPILDADKAKYGMEKVVQVRAKAIPMGRLGRAREVADAILFLASDDASFITGTELIVDGGFTAR